MVFTALLFSADAAQAEPSPWWHLTSGSRPSYLSTDAGLPAKAGVPGVDEVQEITITGENAHDVIVAPTLTAEQINNEEFEGPTKSFVFSEATTEVEAQEGIEGLEGYGAGNVHAQRIDATHYKVTFTGTLAERPVPSIQEGYPNSYGKVTELTKGVLAIPPAEPTDGELNVTAENVGDANANGAGAQAPVRLTDVIPHGLRAVGVAGTEPFKEGDFQAREPIPCALEETAGVQSATCTLSKPLAPFDQIEMRINVKIQGGHTGELNELDISGGGAPSKSIERPITISSEPVPFGVENYEFGLEEDGGTTAGQAAAHPFQLTTTIALNQLKDINPLVTPPKFRPEVTPPGLAKDLSFALPAGLIGNATVIPQCTTTEFFEKVEGKENKCPPDTAVGVATATVHEPAVVGTSTVTEPIFNLEPREGEPARFGFYVVIANSPVFLDTSVRTGGDYGVNVSVSNITQTAAFLSSEVTFWGVPGDPRHDEQRGWGCLYKARGGTVNQPCTPSEEAHPKPFLSLPTSCDTALASTVEGDPWSTPGAFFAPFSAAFEPSQALVGCNRIGFGPEFALEPEHAQASTPTGVTADVHVPQEEALAAGGLAPSDLKATTVVLPEGLQLNASAAGGLEGCTQAQAGFTGFAELDPAGEPGVKTPQFTPEEQACPDGSKLAKVTVSTPLLPNPLKGFMYLASPQNFASGPQENPFGTLLAAYLVVRDPVSGVLVKLAGEGKLNKATGQITLSFSSPQVPFEDARFEFFSGERAPVATPAHCGTYTTQATFTPWSHPPGGTSSSPPVLSSSSFNITSGPGGSACPPASLPFAPTLAAGSTNVNAGAFGPLLTSIGRQDGEQLIDGVQLHMPAGVSGVIAGIPRCGEAQANAGTCGAASLIGHVSASVGIGKDPFTVTGGQVFLTEGYKGAPFGLSIVTPAVAGPFNLGNVIVRAKIEVDPSTAALTVTTDQIPHILKGIPLEIKHVDVTVDRSGFTFNPTSCSQLAVTGAVSSVEGATAAVSAPFQVTNCAALKFAPKLTASVTGHASKAKGAGLTVKVTAKRGEANIRRVELQLPTALPSRLTTLQKACTEAQFDKDPAGCPPGSFIGTATARTPVLAVPLLGPAIIVSHGGAAFPDVEFLLQGEGVHITLDGKTQIKRGITYSRFQTVPDEPITSFEAKLPAGPHSILGAHAPGKSPYQLCGQKLTIPTQITGQNGALLKQTTKIGVSGCPPTRAKKKAHKAKRKKGKKRAK